MKNVALIAVVAVVVVVLVGAMVAVPLSAPDGSLIVGVKNAPSTRAVSHIYLTITGIILAL